uniref:Uncharacterized protein n=1 Tax=Cannabis sativa TaxID=3483 RepID=A0A803NLH1_CANSA
MNIYSQNSSPSIHLTDEEALIHDFDHVSLNPEPQTESFCLVMKVLTSKSRKRDWVGNAMKDAWTVYFPFTFFEYHFGLLLVHLGCE